MPNFPKIPFRAIVKDAFGRSYLGTVVGTEEIMVRGKKIVEYRVVDVNGRELPRSARDITPVESAKHSTYHTP